MKRMKKAVITAMLAVCVLATASAQTGGYRAASEAQRKEIVAKITQTAASVRTMKCDFTQVKQLSFMNDKVTSEGRMYYKKANKIRWEYTRPYAYVFSTDGTTVHMTSGKGGASNRVPVKSSKLFSEISRVMVGGVSGAGGFARLLVHLLRRAERLADHAHATQERGARPLRLRAALRRQVRRARAARGARGEERRPDDDHAQECAG